MLSVFHFLLLSSINPLEGNIALQIIFLIKTYDEPIKYDAFIA